MGVCVDELAVLVTMGVSHQVLGVGVVVVSIVVDVFMVMVDGLVPVFVEVR